MIRVIREDIQNKSFKMNESAAESITASLPISKNSLKEIASKFNGKLMKRGKMVDFNGNSDNLAKAIKYLRTTDQRDIPFIIVSTAFDNGYMVTPKNYNINE